MKTIKTRTRNMLVGSDYSAQEPRITAFISQDPNMLKAYNEGKDLYAVIAQSAFDNAYEDNLENYAEGTVLEEDGKRIVAGNGQEYIKETDENDSITLPYYYLVETPKGDIKAENLNINDLVKSDLGNLIVSSILKNSDNTLTICFKQ